MAAAYAHFGLTWLVRLRWLTLAAQGLAVATAATGPEPVPLGAPLGLLAAVALSNLIFAVGRAAPPVGAVLVVDVLVLTALLHLTGGPMNPFTALYFVFITMAAVLLGTRWVVALLACAVAGYAALFAVDDPVAHHAHDFRTHLRGMWIAFGVVAALLALFLTRLTRALAAREIELARERDRAARSAQVAALTGLAAGAAHELGTPINTMVLAAGELERALAERALPAAILEDARLIRDEGRRCRAVLDGLSEASGEARGEGFAETRLGDIVEAALAPLDRARVRVSGDLDATAELPVAALSTALRNLTRNALEASADPVALEVHAGAEEVALQVVDRGEGMSPEVAARAVEPFFTTKPAGAGMGLGLFLVQALAEQLEGALEIDSRPGAGTTMTLRVPRAPDRRRET